MKPSPRHFGGRAVFQFRGLEWPEPSLGERGEIQERGPEWRFSPLPKEDVQEQDEEDDEDDEEAEEDKGDGGAHSVVVANLNEAP